MVIMFTCAGTVVMSSSGDAEGVTVVYGTRVPGLVVLSLFFLIQSGLAGVVSSVHASFCYTSRAGSMQAAGSRNAATLSMRSSDVVDVWKRKACWVTSGLGRKSFSVRVACWAWRQAFFRFVFPLMILR